MVAILILAVVTVVCLSRRIEIVRDAIRFRDWRTCWALASQKMGELELDPMTFQGDGGGSSGDFHELSPDYSAFLWEYELHKEDVPTNDPRDKEEQPKQIFRLRLTVRAPSSESDDDAIVIEGLYPVPDQGGTGK